MQASAQIASSCADNATCDAWGRRYQFAIVPTSRGERGCGHHEVEWEHLLHAYGPAVEVRGWLADLRDPERRGGGRHGPAGRQSLRPPAGAIVRPISAADRHERNEVAQMGTFEGAADGAVLAPAFDYMEGWYRAEPDRVARAVHPELSKRFIRTIGGRRSHLEECGASKLIAWTAAGRGAEIPPEYRKCEATVIDRSGWGPRGADMAVVKLVGANGAEYLQEAQVGQDWKIINILGEPRTEAPFRPSFFKTEPPSDDTLERSEDGQVIDMAAGYLGSWCAGDPVVASRHVHQNVSKKSLREDNDGRFFIEAFGYPKFIAWTGFWGEGTGSPKLDIKVLDRTEETASVRIDWNFDASGEPLSLDYVDAAKVNGVWQAVNILWGFPRGFVGEDWLGWYW